MFRTKIGILLLIVTIGQAFAQNEARLLNQSSSGQTVVFNLGTQDGIKRGDFTVVLKQIRSLDSADLRIVPAGKARNVKINSDSSVWILYKIYDPELMVKGDKFLLLSESSMLKGRKEYSIGRVALINQKNKSKSQTNDALNDDKDRLSKLKNKYETITPTHEQTLAQDTDAELMDVDIWGKAGKERFRQALYRSPNKKEFKRELRLATFEKLVTAYLTKVNEPGFNYDAFYEEQKKEQFAHEFRTRANFDDEYYSFLRQQSRRASADAKLFRSVLEKGESWSEDYSDEELRRVLGEVSILQERDRRDLIASKPTRYSLNLDYGFFLTDAQSNKDPLYRRDNRYTLEADFEAVPFLGQLTLERFTINGSFRLGHNAFEADSYNADMDEYSMTLGANWYPLYAPYVVESPVVFMGAYIRSGYATVQVPTADEKANYTLMSMPGVRVGFKYLLRNRIGVRMVLSMETLKLERYESSRMTPVLPERTNLVEGKLGVGLNYSF